MWKKANRASREVQARKQPSSTVSALVPALRSCLGPSPAIDYNLYVKQILYQVALVVVCVTATEAPSFTTVLSPLTDPPGYPCPFKFANTGGLLGSGVKKNCNCHLLPLAQQSECLGGGGGVEQDFSRLFLSGPSLCTGGAAPSCLRK